MHNLILISIRLKTCCFFQHMDIFINHCLKTAIFTVFKYILPMGIILVITVISVFGALFYSGYKGVSLQAERGAAFITGIEGLIAAVIFWFYFTNVVRRRRKFTSLKDRQKVAFAEAWKATGWAAVLFLVILVTALVLGYNGLFMGREDFLFKGSVLIASTLLQFIILFLMMHKLSIRRLTEMRL